MGGGDIEAVQGVGGGVRVEVGRDGVGQGREGAGAVPGINQSQGKVDEAGEVWRGVLFTPCLVCPRFGTHLGDSPRILWNPETSTGAPIIEQRTDSPGGGTESETRPGRKRDQTQIRGTNSRGAWRRLREIRYSWSPHGMSSQKPIPWCWRGGRNRFPTGKILWTTTGICRW